MMKNSDFMEIPEDIASAIAIEALTFMIADQDRIGDFLAMTGVGPGDIKERLNDQDFHAGIIDALLSDEKLLMEFCENKDIKPEHVVMARRALPGGISEWN